MTNTRYDVIGIGNAIVDILGRCDDAFLEKHGAPKGHMRLVDAETVAALYKDMGPAIEVSGGSAANTMAGIASFGGTGAFVGTVADDEFGKIFRHDIRAAGVSFETDHVSDGAPTSRSLILVTPDGERTMNTFLGISTQFHARQIEPEAIKAAKITYLEGYLFDLPESKQAFRTAISNAKAADRKVALSLSDGFCVDRHRGEFLDLIRSGVDILFANEDEIKSLYETDDFEQAAVNVAMDVQTAALTRGSKGSLIIDNTTRTQIPAEPVSKVVDTTGAGDLYAAGILYGLSSGHDIMTSGRLGSLAAAEVISHMGARPERPLNEFAKEKEII